MKVFILEDEINGYRNPIKQILEGKGHTLTIAKSVDEAKSLYPSAQPYDFLLLDHDMNGIFNPIDHPTCAGRFCEWLVKHPQVGSEDDPKVLLHSQNDAGRRNMKKILGDAGFRVKELAYSPGYIQAITQHSLDQVHSQA